LSWYFRRLQRGKALKRFRFLDGYLLALDGTGYFSSQRIHRDSRLVKKHRNGTVSYEHQLWSSSWDRTLKTLMRPGIAGILPASALLASAISWSSLNKSCFF